MSLDTSDLSPKRQNQLSLPVIAEEVRTINIMAKMYCRNHHKSVEKVDGLCPDCADFFQYAVKRLSCCPFGEDKPPCKKCKIHCFQKDYKIKAKEIMSYSGPRLIYTHPILAVKHVISSFKEAPEKRRGGKSLKKRDLKEKE